MQVCVGVSGMSVSEDSTVLSSWKDIARYLGKGVRTVQRWERHLGLPVRRPVGASQKSAVLLYRGDVDAWLATRFSARALEKNETAASQTSRSARSNLRESIKTARELRRANYALTQQITASVRLLTERCDWLNTQARRGLGWPEFERPAEQFAVEPTSVPELLPASLPSSNPEPSERIA
jgi:hypothetical protein